MGIPYKCVITFPNFDNSENIICIYVVALPVAEHHVQATAGGLLPASLDVVKIIFERKACPTLAIQKRKMKFKLIVVSETAFDFN